jgi:phosphomethylpyrimidine synthase
MRISADVREYAKTHGIDEAVAAEAGMAEKSAEFVQSGGRVYLPVTS